MYIVLVLFYKLVRFHLQSPTPLTYQSVVLENEHELFFPILVQFIKF